MAASAAGNFAGRKGSPLKLKYHGIILKQRDWVESQLHGLQQGSSFNGFTPVHHFVDMQPEPDSTLLGWILRFLGSTKIPEDDLNFMFPQHQSFEVRASSHRISIRHGAQHGWHQNFEFCWQNIFSTWKATVYVAYAWTNEMKCRQLAFFYAEWRCVQVRGQSVRKLNSFKGMPTSTIRAKTCAHVNVQIQLMLFGSQSGWWDVSHAVSSSFRRGRIRMLLARLAKQADVILWVCKKNCPGRPSVLKCADREHAESGQLGRTGQGLIEHDRVWHLTLANSIQFTLVCHKVFHPSRAHWSLPCPWLQALVTAGASAEQVGVCPS